MKLKNKVMLLALGAITLTTIIILSTIIVELNRKNTIDIEIYRESMMEDVKQALTSNVEIVHSYIQHAYSIDSSAAQQAAILDRIKSMRYDEGVGYFWINDMGSPIPSMVMHATVPSLDGKLLNNPSYNVAMGQNKNLFTAAVEVCEKEGAGFVDYLWPKPSQEGLTQDQPKLSYVKLFKPLNWVIGTGVYIDDIEARLAAFTSKSRQATNKLIRQNIINAVVILIVLALSVKYIFGRTMRTVDELAAMSDDLASGEGDLTRRINISGKDDIARLSDNMDTFLAKIDAAMGRVKNISGDVMAASSSLSGASTQFAETTQDMASSLEQTAATMEQITSSVQENANTSTVVAEEITTIAQEAESGSRLLGEMKDAMTSVNTSSDKIEEIVGVVNQIAFQTNLLALNASVEAARAGEHGKGFAVVAGEVRDLATRSAEAVAEITQIVAENKGNMNRANTLSEQTIGILLQVTSKIQEASHSVATIVASTQEQSGAIQQLNGGITQIDSASQGNSHLLETLSESAESLVKISQELQQRVDQFKVSQEQAG